MKTFNTTTQITQRELISKSANILREVIVSDFDTFDIDIIASLLDMLHYTVKYEFKVMS